MKNFKFIVQQTCKIKWSIAEENRRRKTEKWDSRLFVGEFFAFVIEKDGEVFCHVKTLRYTSNFNFSEVYNVSIISEQSETMKPC